MTTSTIELKAPLRGAKRGAEEPAAAQSQVAGAAQAEASVDDDQAVRKAARRALGSRVRRARRPLALSIGLGMVEGGAVVLQALALARTLAAVFLEGAGLPEVQGHLMAYAGLAVLRAACRWWADLAAANAAHRVKASLRQELTAHFLRPEQVMAVQTEAHSGQRATVLTEGVEALDAYVSQYVPRVGLAVGLPLMFLAVMFGVDGVAATTLLFTLPLIPVFMVLVGSRARLASQRQWTTLKRLGVTFLDVLQGLPTLKVLGQSRRQLARLQRSSERFRSLTMDVLKVAFLSALILELVATLSVALVAVGVGLRLLHGWLDYPTALFVLLLAPEAYAPLRALGAAHHAAMAGHEAAESIFRWLGEVPGTSPGSSSGGTSSGAVSAGAGSAEPSDQTEEAAMSLPGTEGRGDPQEDLLQSPSVQRALQRGPIRLNDVGMSFGSREVVRGVSLTLRRGETVALVGSSGAGKSTLGHLVLGLLQPTVGQIEVGGQNLRAVSGDTWRRQVAWVPQQPHIFAASLAENVRFGAPSATDDEVRQALGLAGLEDLESDLPDGLATPLGERGSTLSGGQVRRLALARALLRQAPWWVLDEPTEHLDDVTQGEILRTLHRVTREAGRLSSPGLLLIAHRPETVRLADRVVKLHDGVVVVEEIRGASAAGFDMDCNRSPSGIHKPRERVA